MNQFLTIDEMNELLEKFKGGELMIEAFLISHRRAFLTVFRKDIESSIIVLLAGCESMCGPFTLKNISLTVRCDDIFNDQYSIKILSDSSGSFLFRAGSILILEVTIEEYRDALETFICSECKSRTKISTE